MMIDRNFPVVGTNGHRDRAEIGADTLADIMDFPAGDPLLQLKNDEQRAGAWKALSYVFTEIGRDGIVTKHLAIRALLGLEPKSMAQVASIHGISRAAISEQANALADALQIPHLRSATSRENYRRAQLAAWKKRKEKNMEPIKFELRRIAVRGWSVAASTDKMLRIFSCPEQAKEYAKVAARGRRAILVVLDADGSRLSSHEINAGSAQ